MPFFFASIKPFLFDFLTGEIEEASEKMIEHFHYLKGLWEKGISFRDGPTMLDSGPKGIYIEETENEAQVKALIENYPSIVSGIQNLREFDPTRMSLYRNMNKRDDINSNR